MARWIFEFQSQGERTLSEIERLNVRRQAIRTRSIGAVLALIAVLLFAGGLIFVTVAADHQPLAWCGVILLPIGGFWVMARASEADKFALLLRRASRLGVVEKFVRIPGDKSAKRMWNAPWKEEDDPDDAESNRPWGTYWSEEEKFEENLAQVGGMNPDVFEAVSQDGVVFSVEGKPVQRLIEPYVWETKD